MNMSALARASALLGYHQDAEGAWWYYPPNGKRRYGAIETACFDCGRKRVVMACQARPRCAACQRTSIGMVDAGTGARRPTRAGYISIKLGADDPLAAEMSYCRRGWVLEHRYLMRKAIGRRFKRGEIVHHINGDRTDNRLENLQLLARGAHKQGQVARCPACGYHGMIFAGQGGGGMV